MDRFLARCLKFLGISGHLPTYEIYTDGSLKKGIGAWAFVVVQNDVVIHEASGREMRTDSNRMEFRAALEALQWLPASSEVVLHSDSRIVIDTLTQWRHAWKAAGWVRERQRKIYNLDYIQALDSLNKQHSITWKWVRAHSGLKYNERCDSLCVQARAKPIKNRTCKTPSTGFPGSNRTNRSNESFDTRPRSTQPVRP